ncbi:MAG: PQQ-binding-like beta-propeller repeat protein [Pseudomonadota bacterium]
MNRFPRFCMLTFTALALAGCGSLFKDDDKPPLPGERISVIALQRDLQPDTAAEGTQTPALPDPWQNAYWPQAGGFPTHVMQNPALGRQVQQVWSTDIGKGSSRGLPLTAQPIVADGRVYTLDTNSVVQATDLKTGDTLWRISVKPKREDEVVIGGGLSMSAGRLFVAAGYAEIAVVDVTKGVVMGRIPLPSAARAAPTVLDERIYVTTLDNRLLAFQALDGIKLWEFQGLPGETGLVRAASAGATRDIVVPVFSSGEIYALRVENGSVAWGENLGPVTEYGGIQSISAISGLPVLDTGLVIAASYGAKIAAIDERTGQRLWQRDIGSAHTPWVAGEWVYVLSTNNEIVALHKLTGQIRWVTPLKDKNKDKWIQYAGPVLAGNLLYVASSEGHLLRIDPLTGQDQGTLSIGSATKIAPIVANETLLLVTEDGSLIAYR